MTSSLPPPPPSPPSLRSAHPHLSSLYHPTLNKIPSSSLPSTTPMLISWKCPNGPDHTWQSTISTALSQITPCPCCRGDKASVTNSLKALHPHVADMWHSSNSRDPDKVLPKSRSKATFKCPIADDHIWTQPICGAVQNLECPACAGRMVSSTNSVLAIRADIAGMWDESNKLGAGDVLASSTGTTVLRHQGRTWEVVIREVVEAEGLPTPPPLPPLPEPPKPPPVATVIVKAEPIKEPVEEPQEPKEQAQEDKWRGRFRRVINLIPRLASPAKALFSLGRRRKSPSLD